MRDVRVRGQALAEHANKTRGVFRIEDDFLGNIESFWTVRGAGTYSMANSVSPANESAGGGAVRLSTGATAGNNVRLDMGQNPFHTDHYNIVRALIKSDTATEIEYEVGFEVDGSNYAKFRGDGGASSITHSFENSDAGTVNTTTSDLLDLGMYLLEIEINPYEGSINYSIDDRGTNFWAQSSRLTEIASHTTEIPSGQATPYISLMTTEAVDKTMDVDFIWAEGERSPPT